MRLAALFWVVLVVATGFAMFAVKYEVQGLEAKLSRTQKAIASENGQIHVLNAEWAYLNRPTVLAALNMRYLSLAPVTTQQLQKTIADIPMRPAAPQPDLVAAAPAPNGPPAVAVAAVARPIGAPVAQPIAVHPPRSLGELIAEVAGR